MLAHGELKRDSHQHFHPQIPSHGYWGTPTPDVVNQSGLVLAALTGCEDEEHQERWEAAGRSTIMFRVPRVQVEARLLPPHAPRGGRGHLSPTLMFEECVISRLSEMVSL